MSTAVLDMNTLREVTKQPVYTKKDPLGLEQLRAKIEVATEIIQERWDEIPSTLKNDVIQDVYLIINSPNLPLQRRIARRLLAFVGFLVLVYRLVMARDSMHSFFGYAQAFEKLIQAVLDAVERENTALQQAIQVSKEEEGEEIKGTTAGEFGDFLRRL